MKRAGDDPPVCLFLKHDAKYLIFESRRAFIEGRVVATSLSSLMHAPRRLFFMREC